MTGTLRARGLMHRSVLHGLDIAVVEGGRGTGRPQTALGRSGRADRQGGIAPFPQRVDGLEDVVGIYHAPFEVEPDATRRLRPMEAMAVRTLDDPETIRRRIARDPGFLVLDDPALVRQLRRA